MRAPKAPNETLLAQAEILDSVGTEPSEDDLERLREAGLLEAHRLMRQLNINGADTMALLYDHAAEERRRRRHQATRSARRDGRAGVPR